MAALILVLVFGSAAAVTLHLKHSGERGIATERDLQGMISQLHTQDALEWRVISLRYPPREVGDDLAQSRQSTRLLLRRAATEGLSKDRAFTIATLHLRYWSAVDEEMRLVSNGDLEEAEDLDESQVDPAFDAVEQMLSTVSDEIAATAARSGKLSDIGLLATIGLALLLTAGLLSRRQAAQTRRRQEQRSEARYRALVDQSLDVVLVTSPDGHITYMSPTAERTLRRPGAHQGDDTFHSESAALPLGTLLALVHPDDRELMQDLLDGAHPDRDVVGHEIRLLVHNPVTGAPSAADLSDTRIFEISVQDLRSEPAVAGMVVTGYDVTDRLNLQREVEYRSLHDSLTNLPNRTLLNDRLGQALRAGHRDGCMTGLLLIDLDRFKEINDTLGHLYGDHLLSQVAARLSSSVRAVDTVARLGGDEFAVVLPGVADLAAATAVADKLQEALTQSFDIEGITLDVEASIGVVVADDDELNAPLLMQHADVAMYGAKRDHLGICIYDPGTDFHTPRRLALLGDLRRALREGQLFLHYQPKVSITTGDVCGAEALLRWNHPEQGLIPPDSFIPLAENTGLIGPLTLHVLNLALEQARRWIDQGRPLQMAVNLSARNLLDKRLDVTVADYLARHGVPAELLKLEVTETAIMADPEHAEVMLHRLADLGVAISIDDFGVGYTCLQQLRNLPISELKVDQSFITGMNTDPSNIHIVRSVVELGHNLGLSSVAEGVESADELTSLAAMSCDVAQGFHLSRPMAAGDFDRWRADWPGLPGTIRTVTSPSSASMESTVPPTD